MRLLRRLGCLVRGHLPTDWDTHDPRPGQIVGPIGPCLRCGHDGGGVWSFPRQPRPTVRP